MPALSTTLTPNRAPGVPPTISCHLYVPGSSIPAGFGIPWDPHSGMNELLIRATCEPSSIRLDFGKGSANQYIYKTSYHYHEGMSGWNSAPLASTEELHRAVLNDPLPPAVHMHMEWKRMEVRMPGQRVHAVVLANTKL